MTRVPPAASAFIFLGLLAGPAGAGILDDYLSLVTGSFDSSRQAAQDERYDNAIWHTARIWSDEADAHWTYTENWLAGKEKPYRQRINRYELESDGSILVSSYEVPDANRYVGAWRNPDIFDQLDPAGLAGPGLCPARLARTGPRRFEGGTDGQRCRNSYSGADYMVSHSLATEGGVENWDRGFSADGQQVWGPAAGPYRFRRAGDADDCQEPVLMLVYGEIFDRAGFGQYIQTLGKSGLYPRHGGYYRAISPVLDTFEGTPPAGRGIVLARFPCLQAAREFWKSEDYQAIKELRKGKAEFEVNVLREFPVADYVDW